MYKDIPMNTSYSISMNGQVKNNKTERIIIPWKSGRYYYCRIGGGEYGKKFLIHRLMALTWLPNFHDKQEVDHKDRNPENNKLFNLHWVTRAENCNNRTYEVKPRKGNKIGYLNITKPKNSYVVRIKDVYLGSSLYLNEAIMLRNKYVSNNEVL
jgi:hypothetical protein